MPQAAITDRSPHSLPFKRHRPEQTLLYQIIEQHYPEFRDVMVMQGKSLPLHVQQEFADYLKCGVFAPNSKHRVEVTPAKRGKGSPHSKDEDKTPEQRHMAMTWAQRLKRVFNIDVSICPKCGGEAKVIACIKDQTVIGKILRHLQAKGELPPPPNLLPATRASPDAS